MNTEQREILKKHLGEKCDTFEKGCATCEIWQAFEQTEQQVREECMRKLPEEVIIHEYIKSQNTPYNHGWNDYRNKAIKALTNKE